MTDLDPMNSSDKDPFTCPCCGEDVPPNAKSCQACGSDENTGWSEAADEWSPDTAGGYSASEDFDYESFIKTEFNDQPPSKNTGSSLGAGFVIVVIIILYILLRQI